MIETNTIPLSPFIERRRENESPRTALYVNYNEYKNWASLSNYVIEGTRGTGKTSILTILNYETRWLDKTKIKPSKELELYFTNKPNFIGVYFRCEEIEKELWNRWSNSYSHIKENNVTELNSQILFSTFLNYFFIKKIISALIDIREKNPEYFTENDDIAEVINEVLNLCYPIRSLKPSLYDFSLKSLENALNTTLHDLRQQIYSLIDFNEISKRFCLHTGASCVIEHVCKLIQKKINRLESINYFLLLDDVDRLDPWQLEVINSFISSSEEPISLKLTSTGVYRTKINTNHRSISTTDLFISKLNDDEDPINKKDNINIDDLFTSIFQIRLESVKLKTEHNLDKIFGQSFNIDDVFKQVLKLSTNPAVKSFLNEFENNKSYDKISDLWIDNYKIDPRYNKIQIREEGLDEDNINHRYYNKYRTSAVFSAINYFNLEDTFYYYSFDILKMVSSGSPRHFLRVCDRMWLSLYASLSLGERKIPIDINTQSKAIKDAAQDVFENIENDQFDGEIKVSCKSMCERLGKLFKKFISVESLKKSPECLSIMIDPSKLNQKDADKLFEIFDRLRMFEAIKTQPQPDSKIKVALTPMLAPYYCLPYRSPFTYSYSLQPPSLLLKLFSTEESEANNLINSIYLDRIGQSITPNLFSNE